MADPKHLQLLRQGINIWNNWREINPTEYPDLMGADLSFTNLAGANLAGVNLNGASLLSTRLQKTNLSGASLMAANLSMSFLEDANLSEANLMRAILFEADLVNANFTKAYLRFADFSRAILIGSNFIGANLRETNFGDASLYGADFRETYLVECTLIGSDFTRANLMRANLGESKLLGANFTDANLSMVNMVKTDLTNANLTRADLRLARFVDCNLSHAILNDCHIYGISAWDIQLKNTNQRNLVITNDDKAKITVDNLEVAQFVYLLLQNEKIRDVIDTITTKAVLILGRFIDERKAVLDAIKEELRKHENKVPILFDFKQSENQNFTDTVTTLARISNFIIADLTDPSSIPHELAMIIPNLSTVAIQPILESNQSDVGKNRVYAMFQDFRNYQWVLPIYEYRSKDHLLETLVDNVIVPAESKTKELRMRD